MPAKTSAGTGPLVPAGPGRAGAGQADSRTAGRAARTPADPDVRRNATLDRGLDILELFLDRADSLTIAEISQKLSIPQSSVYRIVWSMRNREWLTLERPHTYRLGNRLLRAVVRAESQSSLISQGQAVLESLTAQTTETSLLTMVSGVHVVCLLRVEGTQTIRASFQPGALLPLHAGASSTVLLAFSSDQLIDQVCASELVRYSPATVTDPTQLRAKLADTRRQGYASSEGEVDRGVTSVAAPVLTSPTRPAVAAVSIVAPSARFGEAELARATALVIDAAGQLERALRGA
jgi:DNA-binding IclR family transcriptional regulator